jgi:hypothetical protein
MSIKRFNTNNLDGVKYKTLNSASDIIATGGVVSQYTSGTSTFRIHTFAGNGFFEVISNIPISVTYLIVAGGGGGGSATTTSGGFCGGGGGAGGLLQGTVSNITKGNYEVVVGRAGWGALLPMNTAGRNGGDSSISFPTALTAIGGGGGGAGSGGGIGGGSGGGGGAVNTPNGLHLLGGAGTAGQGNNGGQGYSFGDDRRASAGGGGAGAVGVNGNLSNGGNGGAGLDVSTFFGQSAGTTYLAGGGGGIPLGNYTAGSGGIGGGGSQGAAGTHGTGGGGGAGRSNNVNGARGGNGIVYIKYQIK